MTESQVKRFQHWRPDVSFPLNRWQQYFLVFFSLALVIIPLFVNLDVLVVRLWDESRRGVNAYEMLKNHNWLVTHYNGQPEMWGTKPPLLIWFQAFWMKILGPGELALRLPSALAGIATCIFLLAFTARYLKNIAFGAVWALGLVTTNGYIGFHAARTGDFDALLTFFMTVYGLSFFLYVEKKQANQLYLFFVFLSLAILTKGIAGMLFIPGLAIYALVRRQFLRLVTYKDFYFGVLIALVSTGSYYLAREIQNPGYLQAVWVNELGGRYIEGVDGHEKVPWFYWHEIRDSAFIKWWPFLIPGILAGFLFKENIMRRLNLFAVAIVASHFLVISLSRTQLYWYNLPEYPFFAFFIASFVWAVISWIFKLAIHFKYMPLKFLSLAFLIMIFWEPARLTGKSVFEKEEKPWDLRDHQALYILREALEGKRDVEGMKIMHEGTFQHFLFYTHILNERGIRVSRTEPSELRPGDKVLANQPAVYFYLEKNFNVEIMEAGDHYRIYKIQRD